MLDHGRPVHAKDLDKKRVLMDSALSVWPIGKEVMRFIELHRAFIKKGLVKGDKNRYQTIRILNWLIDAGFVQKIEPGKYKITMKPDEFKLFDYLYGLRDQARNEKMILNWRYGGFLWAFSDGYYLGMPEEAEDHPDVRFIFTILNERLASIFESYRELAIILKERRTSKDKIYLPERFFRQGLVEIIPWWLESKIGNDLDGLDISNLRNAILHIIDTLPDEIEKGDFGTRTQLEYLKKMLPLIIRPLEEALAIPDWGTPPDDRSLISETSKKTNQFAMIITEPEYLIDEMSHEKRDIYRRLEEWARKRDVTDLYIASSLPLFNESEIVIETLNTYGEMLLGRTRSKNVMELYKKIQASNWLSLHGPLLINRHEVPEILQKQVSQLLSEGYKSEDLIKYLAFSRSPINYAQPTEDKINFISRLFPNVPKKNVRSLYLEGVQTVKEMADKAFTELEDLNDEEE